MLTYLLFAIATAAEPVEDPGTLVVDAKVPTEVLVDGHKLAQLWTPGEVSFEVHAGLHHLRIYTNGQPADYPIQMVEGEIVRVVVGRTGTTLDALPQSTTAEAPTPMSAVPVEFRSVGQGVQLRLDRKRIMLDEGERKSLELPPGNHRMSVRSHDGTVIWATGTLEVGAGSSLVVQLPEGRLPELSGSGRFHAGGG